MITYKRFSVNQLSIESISSLICGFLKYKQNSSLVYCKFAPGFSRIFSPDDLSSSNVSSLVFFDFSITVKVAPHECVIRTRQP